MTTLSENRIKDALDKASKVGLVEERFTVMGCEVVLRNLRPDEYQAIADETRDLKDVDFAYSFQMGHVCRSIIEVGGVDLRDVDYIETEVPDPKDPGHVKKVNLERHDWLKKKILASWGKEALMTIYRKFSDVIDAAEKLSAEGVTFNLPDETPEDIFRRLVGELKALEESLPETLVVKILEENGYGHSITQAELEAAQAALGGSSTFKKEVDEPVRLAPEVREALRTPEGRDRLAEAVQPTSPDIPSSEAPRQDPRELMRRRQPLNQAAPQQPIPTPQQPPQPVAGMTPVVTAKARAYADLEAAAAEMNGAADMLPDRPKEVPELSRPMDRTPQQVAIDAPPMAGINPRYRPPPRP